MIQLVTQGTEFLIPLVDAKKFLRVDSDFDDALIYDFIRQAQKRVEKDICRAITINSYKYVLKCAEDKYDENLNGYNRQTDRKVVRVGQIAVLTSITTFDEDGTPTVETIGDYVFENYDQFSEIIKKDGSNFPDGSRTFSPLEIAFTAGYTEATLPSDLRIALLQIIANWYECREGLIDGSFKELPQNATAILSQYKVEQL